MVIEHEKEGKVLNNLFSKLNYVLTILINFYSFIEEINENDENDCSTKIVHPWKLFLQLTRYFHFFKEQICFQCQILLFQEKLNK